MKKLTQFFLLFLLILGLRCVAQEVATERNVPYGEADGQKLLADVYRPAATSPSKRPAVLFIHGGGWAAGSKEDYGEPARNLAAKGYVTFSINYRLVTPGHNHWPAQLDDVQRAVRWIRLNAEKYGVDPERIGALGHSAGGHLVTCLGTRDTHDNSDPALAKFSSRVCCVIDMSGPTDLVSPMNSQADSLVASLLGGAPAEQPAAAKDASPLLNVDAKSAPFLILHGQRDQLVTPDHAEKLDKALRAAGIESKLLLFEEEGHGIEKPENSQRMIQESLAFLQKHLAP